MTIRSFLKRSLLFNLPCMQYVSVSYLFLDQQINLAIINVKERTVCQFSYIKGSLVWDESFISWRQSSFHLRFFLPSCQTLLLWVPFFVASNWFLQHALHILWWSSLEIFIRGQLLNESDGSLILLDVSKYHWRGSSSSDLSLHFLSFSVTTRCTRRL